MEPSWQSSYRNTNETSQVLVTTDHWPPLTTVLNTSFAYYVVDKLFQYLLAES